MDNFTELFLSNYTLKGITINTTNQCNLRCSYCFEQNKHDLYMTIDDCKKILDEVTNNFEKTMLIEEPNASFDVAFFGGEPTLNFDIIKYTIEYLREKPYECTYGLTTNFVNITDEMLDVFYDNDFSILVSIDGLKEIHDKNRCNSYDKVVGNIKRSLDKGLKLNLEARITILPSDINYLFEATKNVFEMGIDNIAPCVVMDVPWTDENYIEFEKQVKLIYDWTIAIYNDEENKRNLQVKVVNDFLELSLDYKNDNTPCGFGKDKWISVGPDGEIAPCHQVHTNYKNCQELIVGNILTRELDVDRINNIRDNITRSKCFDCKFYHFCRGGCPIENMRLNGSFTSPSENTCKINEIMYNIAKEYQEKILNSTNSRSRRLNILKYNLELKKLSSDIKTNIVPSCISQINSTSNDVNNLGDISKLQEMICNNGHVLLPQFENAIREDIDDIQIQVLKSFVGYMENMIKELENHLKELNDENMEKGD